MQYFPKITSNYKSTKYLRKNLMKEGNNEDVLLLSDL